MFSSSQLSKRCPECCRNRTRGAVVKFPGIHSRRYRAVRRASTWGTTSSSPSPAREPPPRPRCAPAAADCFSAAIAPSSSSSSSPSSLSLPAPPCPTPPTCPFARCAGSAGRAFLAFPFAGDGVAESSGNVGCARSALLAAVGCPAGLASTASGTCDAATSSSELFCELSSMHATGCGAVVCFFAEEGRGGPAVA